jgi:hypothetical protein
MCWQKKISWQKSVGKEQLAEGKDQLEKKTKLRIKCAAFSLPTYLPQNAFPSSRQKIVTYYSQKNPKK